MQAMASTRRKQNNNTRESFVLCFAVTSRGRETQKRRGYDGEACSAI
jgi:hypothetical protein